MNPHDDSSRSSEATADAQLFAWAISDFTSGFAMPQAHPRGGYLAPFSSVVLSREPAAPIQFTASASDLVFLSLTLLRFAGDGYAKSMAAGKIDPEEVQRVLEQLANLESSLLEIRTSFEAIRK